MQLSLMVSRYFFGCLGLFCCIAVQSGALHISPTQFSLQANDHYSVLKISNASDQAVRVQADIMHWLQDQGEDILRDSTDFLLNPPIFTIPAQGTQYLRFGLRYPQRLKDAEEISYRFLLEELPGKTPTSSGIHTRWRLSLPVFIEPKIKKTAWRALIRQSQGALIFKIQNLGNFHQKILKIAFDYPGGGRIEKDTWIYLLAGAEKEWVWDDKKINDAVPVKFFLKTETTEVEKILQPNQELLFH